MRAFVTREPALVFGLAQSLVALIVAFGLKLSGEQIGAIMAVVSAMLAAVTRALVVPVNPPDQKVTRGT